MKRPKRILLPQSIEEEAMKLLKKAGCEILLSPDTKVETLQPLMKGVNAVILRTGIKMTRELMKNADDLWVISRTGAGVDNVDVPAATERGILVTCVPGANTQTVAEHALTLILALMKQIPLMDYAVRNDHFEIRFKNLPRDLGGKTLGLVGLGRIGSELARICHTAFGLRILAHDPYLAPEARVAFEEWVEFCDMERLFKESDIISLHIPFSPSTQKLIGARELGWMKPGAFLVNTSRGGIIDETALIQCLKDKRIGGVGLDVFAQEPLEKNNPLKELDNVILTPHTAALTRECVVRLAVEAVQAALDVFEGKKPNGIVNPEVLTQPRWQGILSS
ncbi:MAG TPA: hydroxyacid dehydrogenase [Thermodesulfobacteriota bacterium]|nr:hydroxyacid dehydrogenase [Thermodesulfobacteriota bacterium]